MKDNIDFNIQSFVKLRSFKFHLNSVISGISNENIAGLNINGKPTRRLKVSDRMSRFGQNGGHLIVQSVGQDSDVVLPFVW